MSLGNSLATGAQPVPGCRDCRPEDGDEGYTSQLYELARSRIPNLVHVNLACGGESANWMLRGHDGELPWCEYEHGTQLADAIAFLTAHAGRVAFITIDIGGNDAAWCAGQAPSQLAREPVGPLDVQTCMSRIPMDVRQIVADLRAAAGPTTPIVGMNYYSPSLAMWLTGPDGRQRAALITDSIAVAFNAALEAAFATGNAPVADVNDNRSPAGRLENGVLEIDLVATPARWYPEADDGPSLDVEAFAEEGGPPRVPGPLIRAPAGTTVHATIRNAVRDTLLVVGLSERDAGEPDTLRLLPGETRDVRFTLREPGTFLYQALSADDDQLHIGGRTGQLIGAMVVDPAVSAGSSTAGPSAAPPPDRVFLMSVWKNFDTPAQDFLMVINGKSWPHTERLTLATGDSARWRVINATASIHPMHLHGFHFRVDSRGDGWMDTILPESERPMVVTETVQPGATTSLTWVPERAGRWIFHCHAVPHMSGVLHYFLPGTAHPDPREDPGRAMTVEEGMAGLVLGIEVTGDPAAGLKAGPPARRERLIVTERARVYGTEPGYGFVLQRDAEPASDSVRAPGSPIVITRGELTEITVVNRSSLATAVHWHGIELESYYDGVPGWSGDVARIAPHVMPGDSFTVRMAPPRAGTFIYHTHAKDFIQLSSGLYGPLIVLERGETLDPAADHTLLFSLSGPGDDATVVLNGGHDPALAPLEARRPHRLRFINITAEDEIEVALFQGPEPLAGRLVSKDAGGVPPGEATARPVRFRFGPGETYDFEIVPAAGELRIAVKSYNDFDVIIPVRGR